MGGWGNEDSFSDYTVIYDLTQQKQSLPTRIKAVSLFKSPPKEIPNALEMSNHCHLQNVINQSAENFNKILPAHSTWKVY